MLGMIILYRKIVAGGFCCNDKKLHGQTIIITGANTGIGRETARELAHRGIKIAYYYLGFAFYRLSCISQGRQESIMKLKSSGLSVVKIVKASFLLSFSSLHFFPSTDFILLFPYDVLHSYHELIYD